MAAKRTVFTDLKRLMHDEDFQPIAGIDFESTGAQPGSSDKIEVMRTRVSDGQPLWHENDPIHEITSQETRADGLRVIACPDMKPKKLQE